MLKNFFRTFIVSFAILIVAIYAIGYLLPNTYTLERSIVIQASTEKVFEQIINLQSWKDWSHWAKQDPKAQYTYGLNMDNHPFMEWSGNTIGIGRLDLKTITPHQKIETELRFYSPYQGTSKGTWIFTGDANSTTVTWRNQGTLDDLFSKYYGLMMDMTIGKDFQKGLDNLKKVVEQ